MYVKVTNGSAEIYSIGQLRRDNPNTSFPKTIPEATLAAYSVFPYTIADDPEFDRTTHKIENGAISEIDGKWVQQKNAVALTTEEAQAVSDGEAILVRTKRNELLAETDYLALSDATLTADMATYRQALRDITAQDGFPFNVTYPTKPN